MYHIFIFIIWHASCYSLLSIIFNTLFLPLSLSTLSFPNPFPIFLSLLYLSYLSISPFLSPSNSVKRVPLLGGRELDLYHLYLKVKSLGGSKRITQDRLWGDVARSFNLPASVTSASYACRQNFIK